MGRAQPLTLGPFTGGINTASDPSVVADSELVDCINLELDLDGSLVQRPPLVQLTGSTTYDFSLIGFAFINNVGYLISCTSAGDTYIYNGTTNVLTLLKAGLTSKVALQYRDKIYIVATAGSAQAGGYYDVGAAVFTTQATMPRGESAIFNKARMFIVPGVGATANTSRLQFCDPITADVFVWTATNIIDVSPGDGQKLVDLVVYNDNLMLFKEDSTYVLAYDLQITDAVLRSVNSNIGASAAYCIATYENSVFIYHDAKVYEISNYDFTQINVKVPFVTDLTVTAPGIRLEDISISLVGTRLVVRYYNKVYVYALKTKTWSRWTVASTDFMYFSHFMRLPSASVVSDDDKYFTSATHHITVPQVRNISNLIYMPDGHQVPPSGTLEGTITSSIITKNYDISASNRFKKLMWWGADVLTNRTINGFANPVVQNFKVTWAQLSTYTWNQLSGNTWSAPLSASIAVETDVSNSNSSILRNFIKFRKALRFRQINFSVILSGDGTVTTGPARLFSLTALVAAKETVVKQVS